MCVDLGLTLKPFLNTNYSKSFVHRVHVLCLHLGSIFLLPMLSYICHKFSQKIWLYEINFFLLKRYILSHNEGGDNICIFCSIVPYKNTF
jgi:hypothetical protein